MAEEWGRHLDNKVAVILDSPDGASGKSQSVLLFDAEILTIQLANKHLRDSALTANCEVDRFLQIAEGQFADTTVNGIGDIMYQGNPVVDYDEWTDRLRAHIEVILSEPDIPYDGGLDVWSPESRIM